MEPDTDVVQVLQDKADEENWGQDGDDSRDDADLLSYGDTLDGSSGRSHQNLRTCIMY